MPELIDIVQKLIDSPYATGPDLSKWQAYFKFDLMDFKFVAPALDFVMWKLGFGGTDGHCYEDSMSRLTYAEMEEYPEIFRIGYWYQSSHVPWKVQFDFLCKIVDSMDIDMIHIDGEKIYNIRSWEFAYETEQMIDALIERYPDKKIVLYSNFYIYRDWFRYFRKKFDNYYYHQAQYPYAVWSDITSNFLAFWSGVLTSLNFKPTVPKTRLGRWLLWQFVDRSGLGKFFGVGSKNLDFNMSQLLREDFFDEVGRPERWFDIETPGETIVTPPPEEPVIIDITAPVSPEEPVSTPVEIPDVDENVIPVVEVGSVTRNGNKLSIMLNIDIGGK